jgi:competence protein ComGF
MNNGKKSFTLLELIIVIVVLALISVGTFKAIQMLYQRYSEVNTITKFSILSQTSLSQIGTLMYHRVPITAIGYSPSDGDFKQLADVDDSKYKIFEFINEAFNAKKHAYEDNVSKGYSSFIDLDASNKDTLTLVTKDFNITDINDTINHIFNTSQNLNKTVGIIFAGGLDEGDSGSDYNDSFGWHGHKHKKVFLIDKFKQVGQDANLTMNSDISGNKIYAKFYLSASAWGLARGADIDKNSNCLKNLNINDNTLLLFYNYRPWNNETFCADPHQDNTEQKAGGVSILAQNITAFKISETINHIEIKLQFSKPLFRGSDKNITITKQKVIF